MGDLAGDDRTGGLALRFEEGEHDDLALEIVSADDSSLLIAECEVGQGETRRFLNPSKASSLRRGRPAGSVDDNRGEGTRKDERRRKREEQELHGAAPASSRAMSRSSSSLETAPAACATIRPRASM